jgi:hypothetical protein
MVSIDSRYVDRRTCDFPIRVHEFGRFKIADYYEGDGTLVKEILTAGAGGPFTFADTANGTTLTMQMQSAPIVTTYNADRSVRSVRSTASNGSSPLREVASSYSTRAGSSSTEMAT